LFRSQLRAAAEIADHRHGGAETSLRVPLVLVAGIEADDRRGLDLEVGDSAA
jgi:hypothetical protein